jgi:hypothetical protein
VAAGRKRKSDAELIVALACGASTETAAEKAKLNVRTVYRRLKDPAFVAQVNEMRADMVRRTSGMLTIAGFASVKTLTSLQESANSEAVRLGAARATLELACKLREDAEWTDRLAKVEQRLKELLGGADEGEPLQ